MACMYSHSVMSFYLLVIIGNLNETSSVHLLCPDSTMDLKNLLQATLRQVCPLMRCIFKIYMSDFFIIGTNDFLMMKTSYMLIISALGYYPLESLCSAGYAKFMQQGKGS